MFCFPLEIVPPAKKNISCSRTFGSSTESFQEVRAAIAYFTARAAEKLRRQKLVAGSLAISISTDRFKKDDAHYSAGTTLNIAPKSDFTPDLTALAMKGLEKIFRAGFKIRQAGVLLGALELAANAPRRLWDDSLYEPQRRLMQAVDFLNRRFGRDTVSCGFYPSAEIWHTRFAMRSPRYTTRWDDICHAAA